MKLQIKDKLTQHAAALTYLVIQIFAHLSMYENSNSDGLRYFVYQLDEYSLVEFVQMRYQTWSSRVWIEGLCALVCRNTVVWKIIDICVWMLIFWCLQKIFSKKYSWHIVALLLLFPLGVLNSAGWMATTMNYTWPVAAALFVFVVLAQHLREERVPVWYYILSVPAVIFATSVEGVCAAVVGILVVSLFVEIFVQKRALKAVLPLLGWMVLSFCSLASILTCPGNAARTEEEIANYMQNFPALNIFDKLDMGLVDTMYRMMDEGVVLSVVFGTVLLVIAVMKLNRRGGNPQNASATIEASQSTSSQNAITNAILYVTAALPLIWMLFETVFVDARNTIFGAVSDVLSEETFITAGTYHMSRNYIPTLLSALVIIAVIVTLALISENWYECLTYEMIYLAGIGTRLVMGFSPTIFASGMRTYTYYYFAEIALTLLILQRNVDLTEEHRVLRKVLPIIVVLLLLIGCMMTIADASTY